MQDFINKFELSNFLKEIKLATNNHKEIFWHFFLICCLLISLSSSLNITSTIRDLKLKGMRKYKQMWTWHTDIFALCFWLARNYMNIWFRNISSGNVKWKECTRRIQHDCFFFCIMVIKLDFILNFPWLIFNSGWCFFWQLLPSA